MNRFEQEPFGEWGAMVRILWSGAEAAKERGAEGEEATWTGAITALGEEYERNGRTGWTRP